MKNIKKHSLLLLFITIIILYIVLKDDFIDIINILFRINIIYLLISLVIISLNWFFKALSMYFIAKEYSKTIRFSTILRQTVITQFFNGVTPFSTGGQPMEIYMLNKCNVSVARATNIVLQNSMVYQIALVLYGLIALLLNIKLNLFDSISFLKYLVILGFIINTMVCVLIFIVSFSKKTSDFILFMITKIGLKLNIIKDKDKFTEKYKGKIIEFHDSARIYKNNKKLFYIGILLNFISLTFLYSVPFFLALGIGTIKIPFISATVSSAYTLLVGSFVPIPGGSGGIEYSFTQFFGVFTTSANLSALLLIWRFITYYFGMILGGIVFSFYKGDEHL